MHILKDQFIYGLPFLKFHIKKMTVKFSKKNQTEKSLNLFSVFHSFPIVLFIFSSKDNFNIQFLGQFFVAVPYRHFGYTCDFGNFALCSPVTAKDRGNINCRSSNTCRASSACEFLL